jgi:hypothetical protein
MARCTKHKVASGYTKVDFWDRAIRGAPLLHSLPIAVFAVYLFRGSLLEHFHAIGPNPAFQGMGQFSQYWAVNPFSP